MKTKMNRDELRRLKAADIIKLTRISVELADRFERIGLDENGNMDTNDKRLLRRVRVQIANVLAQLEKQNRGAR